MILFYKICGMNLWCIISYSMDWFFKPNILVMFAITQFQRSRWTESQWPSTLNSWTKNRENCICIHIQFQMKLQLLHTHSIINKIAFAYTFTFKMKWNCSYCTLIPLQIKLHLLHTHSIYKWNCRSRKWDLGTFQSERSMGMREVGFGFVLAGRFLRRTWWSSCN